MNHALFTTWQMSTCYGESPLMSHVRCMACTAAACGVPMLRVLSHAAAACEGSQYQIHTYDLVRLCGKLSPTTARGRLFGQFAVCQAPGLRREALGVAREHRGLADVVQAAVQHDHALKANAGAAVRRGTQLEAVDVRLRRLYEQKERTECMLLRRRPCRMITRFRPMPSRKARPYHRKSRYDNDVSTQTRLDGLHGDAALLRALREQGRVVHALRARNDLLAADEDVVGIGVPEGGSRLAIHNFGSCQKGKLNRV